MGRNRDNRLEPAFGAVYWADPKTNPLGDHDPRPVTPVEVTTGSRVTRCITRTTRKPHSADLHVESPPNVKCELDKRGWWTERHQRPIPAQLFTAKLLRYSGRLPSDEAQAVLTMWTTIKMLGRENR